MARQYLEKFGIDVWGYVSSVGEIELNANYQSIDKTQIHSSIVRCPDKEVADRMIQFIEEIRKQGDTVGGTVSCVIQGLPAGIGEPVFDKLNADLAKAMVSIKDASSRRRCNIQRRYV